MAAVWPRGYPQSRGDFSFLAARPRQHTVRSHTQWPPGVTTKFMSGMDEDELAPLTFGAILGGRVATSRRARGDF
jgi:hypothetical protein